MRHLLLALLFTAFAFSASAETYIVKYGDTLSAILANDYTREEIAKIAKEIKALEPSYMLRVGMEIEHNHDYYSLFISNDKEARIYRDDGIAMVAILKYEELLMPTVITGVVNKSLYQSIKNLGEDPELASTIARIYEWEFDFFRDIHPGDTFTVLVEKKFVRNKYIGYGRLLAADFVVQGRHYKAYYFNDGTKGGYYNGEGRALERGFLKVPLSYTKITSVFTDSRMHPIFKEVRPHYGIDYAAPIGTPVMATASGTITKMTYNKASGNYIEIKHSNGYKTYYLHLSGFHKSLRQGSTVAQGQVIGYVGSTGYSTGPHLDYRINHNGKWLNPANFIADVPKLTDNAKMILAEAVEKYDDKLYMSKRYAGKHRPCLIP